MGKGGGGEGGKRLLSQYFYIVCYHSMLDYGNE